MRLSRLGCVALALALASSAYGIWRVSLIAWANALVLWSIVLLSLHQSEPQRALDPICGGCGAVAPERLPDRSCGRCTWRFPPALP